MGSQMRRIRDVAALLSPLFVAGCSSETVAPPPPVPVNWQSLHALPVADAGADTVTALERGLPDLYVKALLSGPGDAERSSAAWPLS